MIMGRGFLATPRIFRSFFLPFIVLLFIYFLLHLVRFYTMSASRAVQGNQNFPGLPPPVLALVPRTRLVVTNIWKPAHPIVMAVIVKTGTATRFELP